jgi:hypothetical protein
MEGFRLHFTSLPPLFLPGANFCTPSQGKNDIYIDQEVEALFHKGAIEEVPLRPPPHSYISSIFLVLKKSGGMRPILNLKRLNAAHLNTPYFRMETVKDVRHALRPGDWAMSIDLRDAYFHIPFHEEVDELRVERPPILLLCPSLWLISSLRKVFTALTKFIKVHSRFGP